MKTVLLLLSSDQFSFPLIKFLIEEGKINGWKIVVGSMFDFAVLDRIRRHEWSEALSLLNITQFKQCERAIQKADVVVALLPDVTLLKVAESCIFRGKSLITPARLNRQMALKKSQAEENNSLMLMECGFSPGLDHITAKKAIDTIQAKGGKVASFRTYSGSFMEKDYADNPWSFKLTEPAIDLINMGKHNNRFLINNRLQHIPYHQLFSRAQHVDLDGIENMVSVPEGDALFYRQWYQLEEAHTIVKGRLLRKGVDHLWHLLVNLGLTNTTSRIDMIGDRSFHSLLQSHLPDSVTHVASTLMTDYHATEDEIEKLTWLGWFDHSWMSKSNKALTSGLVLKYLMEKKLTPAKGDQDVVMMQHRLQYTHQNAQHTFNATLTMKGTHTDDSALANIMAFTLGAAVKAFLKGAIIKRGVCIPVYKEIYDPILNELDDLGVAFQVEERRVWNATVE